MMSLWIKMAILGVCASLGGCTTPMFTMPPGPTDYRVGYHDGCDSGYAYAGSPFYQSIDVEPTAPGVEPYRTGWQTGFSRCRANYQHIQRTLNFLLGPPL